MLREEGDVSVSLQALSGGLGGAVALGFELFELFRHGRVDDRRRDRRSHPRLA